MQTSNHSEMPNGETPRNDQPQSESSPSPGAASRRKARRWVIGTLIGVAFLLGIVAAIVIVVDPFQHYRKATFYVPLLDRSLQRYVNVGLARNYDYDTLSLGSSMTENTRTSDIEAAFGGKALQLAFRGAALINYSETLKSAFKTHEIKRVIMAIDDISYTDSPFTGIGELPDYLYDFNIFNDVKYWFNMDVLARLPELYEYNTQGLDRPSELNLDMLYNWTDGVIYGKARVYTQFQHWDHPKTAAMAVEGIAPSVKGNLERHLLPFVKDHPETEFLFVYPPYSTLQWYHTYLYGQEDRFLYGRTEFARTLLAYPNVRMYDYQTNEEWATDYDQYADFTHYSGAINTAYIQAMGRGEDEIHSVEEIEANNEIIRGFMLDFVPPTEEEMQALHEEAQQQIQERLQWQ